MGYDESLLSMIDFQSQEVAKATKIFQLKLWVQTELQVANDFLVWAAHDDIIYIDYDTYKIKFISLGEERVNLRLMRKDDSPKYHCRADCLSPYINLWNLHTSFAMCRVCSIIKEGGMSIYTYYNSSPRRKTLLTSNWCKFQFKNEARARRVLFVGILAIEEWVSI